MAKKQIMDTLDRLERLISRLRNLPPKSSRQNGSGPFGAVSDILNDVSDGFRRGITTMRYQFGRLMQSTPICNPLATA